jgi:hypothetical protein
VDECARDLPDSASPTLAIAAVIFEFLAGTRRGFTAVAFFGPLGTLGHVSFRCRFLAAAANAKQGHSAQPDCQNLVHADG